MRLKSLRSLNNNRKFRKKRLCNTNILISNSGTGNSLEALTTSRLIPLNKNPKIHPIDVNEVLRRIAGKVIKCTAN